MAQVTKVGRTFIEEAATAEFIGKYANMKVKFKNRVWSIKEFLELARYDTEANRILVAVKQKMRLMRYPKGLLDFLADFFSPNNDTFDVLVLDGGSEGDRVVARYDNTELGEKVSLHHTGKASEAKIIRDAIEFFVDKLFSKQMQSKINVQINVKKGALGGDTIGVVYHDATGSQKQREFEVVIDRHSSEKDQIEALAHELVHIKQRVSNQLQYRHWKTDGKMHVRWQGKDMGPEDEIAYDDQPWEKEAYMTGREMAVEFMANYRGGDDA